MQKAPPLTVVYFDFAIAAGGSLVVLSNTLRSLDREKYAPVVVTGLPAERAQEMFGALQLPIITHRHPVNYVSRFRFLGQPIFNSPWRRRLGSYLFTLYSTALNSFAFLRLLARVRRLDPALIHTHNGIDSMVIAGLLRVPAVLHLHGPFGADSKFEAAIARMARVCICVSQGIADTLAARGVAADRLMVLPNPSPVPALDDAAVQRYRTRFASAPDAVLVAHIGRLVEWKGQMEFLHAFARAAAQAPQLRALVVGDDAEGLNQHYIRELRDYVAAQGLDERVTFTGQIGDIHNLVAAVDIVVHSSTEPEPFGLVVTEAMALAKPVIAASYGATADIVDDGVTGLLADPHDTAALADALLRLAGDAALRARLGAAGLRKAEAEYSIQRYKTALETTYERFVGNQPA